MTYKEANNLNDESEKPKEIRDFLERQRTKTGPILDDGGLIHYYGDLVRKMFPFGAVLMLMGLPFALDLLHLSLWQSLVAIAVLALFAGFTTPHQRWVLSADLAISLIGLLYFEYYAVRALTSGNVWLFIINQSLSVTFLMALYYSTKTLRGEMTKGGV